VNAPATYYYAALNGSEYSFAFALGDNDKIFRRAQEPADPSKDVISIFNLLIEYNSSIVKELFPRMLEHIHIKENEPRYPGLRLTNNHSSIFLAPKCHCDPSKYFYEQDLGKKTVEGGFRD
jgi:voltage-dependent calcium channel alpha-2/delta-3